jgi:glutamate N-acetyltransferase/amino-acid N-acetyltransferase
VAAGTFSKNSVLSPSAVSSREVIRAGGTVRGVVANSGCANCAVGEQGLKDARETQSLAASAMGAKPGEVLICSTGVIGVELPMALIRRHMGTIKPSVNGGHDFARAVITTDTRPKEIAVSVTAGGKTVTVGGCAKGAGMIHPNMATMLAFMTTDAAVEQAFLRKTLSEAVDLTFNQIDVDTDTSTNDTVLLLANGAAGNAPLKGGDTGSSAFAAAVRAVSEHLAKEIARDGEGAKHLIECTVDGARSDRDARVMARSVVSSPLVKTAVYGRDPNWGRIMMAIGKTELPLDEGKIQIFVNGIQIVEGGIAIPYNVQSVVAALGEPEVHLRVSLNTGKGTGVAWGCDLTEGYVVENSAYTT